jgi:hypothetical protein
MSPADRPPTQYFPPPPPAPTQAPFSPTVRVESAGREVPSTPPDPERSSGGNWLPLILLLLSVMLVSAGIGFIVSGGQLSASDPAPTPTAQVAAQPTSQLVAQAQPTVQAPVQAAAPAVAPPTVAPQTAEPQPTATTAPQPTPTAQPEPTTPPVAAQPKPTQPQPTATTAPAKPTAPPQPTAVPPTTAPAAPPPVAKPTTAPSAPGADPRLAQIDGRIRDYFSALNAEDYARAQQVCCTEAWRARYPLRQWERNFDGVTDLRLEGEPRYLRVEPAVVVADTDYTFVSGGQRRNFTLRWTFQPVGNEWQAELAEAFGR